MIRAITVVGVAWLAAGCGAAATDPLSPDHPPVAAFAMSCQDAACSFTDASTDADGRVVSYRWSFGDGLETDTPSPVHTFAVAGTYHVSLSVTDDRGLTDSVYGWVVVPVAPTVLAVNPTRLTFALRIYMHQTASQTITITALRPERIKWAVLSHSSWLTIRPVEGTTPRSVTVSVNPGTFGYRPGVYSGSFTISGVDVRNTPVTVPVTLYIR